MCLLPPKVMSVSDNKGHSIMKPATIRLAAVVRFHSHNIYLQMRPNTRAILCVCV